MRASAILMYHSLDDSGSVISTPPALFRRQMDFLAASGIPVVPLEEAAARPGSVAITFDDGFANLLDHAMPALERHGFPAAIFLVSGYCGGRNNWPTQPRGAVPDLPLMSWEDARTLPPRIALGAHTVTHPHLDSLAPADCERELRECRETMEQRLAKPAPWLAYPYGDSNANVRRIAAKHYALAVGTSLGFLRGRVEAMNLPRIDTYYLTGGFGIERLFTALGSGYIALRRAMREARRLRLSKPSGDARGASR